jgi:type IV pilus assembly protein PilO
MKITVEDLRKLDINRIGAWPLIFRGAVFGVLLIAVLVGGYMLVIKDKLVEKQRAEEQEVTLRQSFDTKQRRAAALDQYRAQLQEMQVTFGALLRLLPGQTEVDNLLVDISQAGLAAGLEQELFQPQRELSRDFYAELPIRMRVTGRFHEFATFASNVAALPRIVTLHDIVITGASGGMLTMELTAKTYRYVEEQGGRG